MVLFLAFFVNRGYPDVSAAAFHNNEPARRGLISTRHKLLDPGAGGAVS
jgi:hypothetical protein